MSMHPGSGQPAGETRRIRTCCPAHNCGGRCLLVAHVRDGVITHLEADDRTSDQPENPRLLACARGHAYLRRQYHPDGLTHPLKRIGKRGEGKFERISWEEALDFVASEIRRVRGSYGNSSLFVPYGTGSYSNTNGSHLARRLFNLYGGHLSFYNNYSWACIQRATPTVYGTNITGNHRQDWLSREMIFALLFGAASAALTLLQLVSLPLVLLQLGLRLLALLAATLLLWSMVRLYQLRTVPAWTALAAAVSFNNAALLLGPASLAAVLACCIAGQEALLHLQKILSLWISVLLTLQLLASASLPHQLRRGNRSARKSAVLITKQHRPAFILWLLSTTAALALLNSGTRLDTPACIMVLCLLWLGEILGRWLFYASRQRDGF